jgi:hypothetical protein
VNGGFSQQARVLADAFRPYVSEEAFSDWTMQDLLDRADARTPFEEDKNNDSTTEN